MKAKKNQVTLAATSALVLATGCWTGDAHEKADAGAVSASHQCKISPSRCFLPAAIPLTGEFLDLSATTVTTDADGKLKITCTPAFSVSANFTSSGFWSSPGPDEEAGVYNGIRLSPVNPNNSSTICHLAGSIPGSASWGIYLNPAKEDTCTDGSVKAGLVDATGFDGISIRIGGNAGKPKQMTFTIDSVGTPEDPYRQQELQTIIVVPEEPTTYQFRWSELTAPCGKAEYFNPAKIVSVGGSMLALAGIAYTFDIELSLIGFYHEKK